MSELIQAGTEEDSSSSGAHYYWWWQVYPYLAYQEQFSFPLSPGDLVEVVVDISITTNAVGFVFNIYNKTAGRYTSISGSVPGTSGQSAESIVERTTENNSLPLLANFGTIYASQSFRAEGKVECAGYWPNTRWDMVDNNYVSLAYSRWTDSNGCSFKTVRTGND